MLVALYARLAGSHYIIDTHTGGLVGYKWGWSLPLHRWLSRRALATIVTNAYLRDRLLGGSSRRNFRVLLLEDPPVEWRKTGPLSTPQPGARQVTVIATYSADEPIEAVLAAARQLPDVSFSISGDARRLPAAVRARCPQNVRLTGWLSDTEYSELVSRANVVVALTTRNHTLLCGAWEALYAGQPFITSDWPVLRAAFPQGTVFTGATSQEIAAAINQALADEDHLRAAMQALAADKRQAWALSIAELLNLIPGYEIASHKSSFLEIGETGDTNERSYQC
jgi:glycosyltransferase involved in cell wall biosynthesis